MAGIFESSIAQGSSLSGESFVKPPSQAVSAKTFDNIAETASNIYGVVQVNKAAKRIGEMQDSFLDDLSSNRQDQTELDSLRDSNPAEQAAFDTAKNRITALQNAMNSRQVNPAEAIARIEAEKRKAMSQAPMFASRIRGLTGARGEVFDAETSQLIKERNDLRDAVVAMGGNPESPSQVEAARRVMAAETEAKYLGSLGKIEGVKASRVAQESINAQIAMQEAIIMSQIEDAGGMGNIGAADTSQIITGIQRFKGPNAINIVNNMLAGMPGIDAALVPPEVKDRMASRISGAADTLEKQLNGTIPKDIFENRLQLEEDTVMINMARDNRAMFEASVIIGKLPPNTIPHQGFAETLANDLTIYAKSLGLGRLSSLSKEGLTAEGVTNPSEVQRSAAANIAEIRKFIANNKGNVDPAFAAASLTQINNQMEAMVMQPKGFVPSMFDEMLSTISSDDFREVTEKVNPGDYERFLDSSSDMIQSYIADNMAPDMSKELSKRVFVGEVIGGSLTSPRVRDLVTPTVSDNGIIRFIPNTGLTTQNGIAKAEAEAKRLTQMYSGRSAAITRATKVLGGAIADDISPKDLTLVLFQEAFGNIDEPFKTNPDVVDTETPLRKSIKPILRRDQ